MEKEVKLFEPKFVRFMWDDSLEGKKGFVADNIDDLQRFVEESKDFCHFSIFKCEGLNRFSRPFFANCASWRFAYYDPNYEVKWAYYKKGKKIQVSYAETDIWIDSDNPEWVDGCRYRVKPDCTCEEKTFRPFKDCDELVKYWTEKYQSVARPAFTMPLIWVKEKKGESVCLISAFSWSSCVFLEDVWVDMKELFDDYEFLDGSPCGKEAKE